MGGNHQDGKNAEPVSPFVSFHVDLDLKLTIQKRTQLTSTLRRVKTFQRIYGNLAQFYTIND